MPRLSESVVGQMYVGCGLNVSEMTISKCVECENVTHLLIGGMRDRAPHQMLTLDIIEMSVRCE